MDNQKNLISIKQDIIFTACIQRYDNFYSFPKHMHKNAEIYFVIEGSCSMYIKDKKITLNKNDFIIIFPHVIHSLFLESSDVCKFYHIHFDLEELSSMNINLMNNAFTLSNLQLYMLSYNTFFVYRNNFKIKEFIENIVTEYNNDLAYSKVIANLSLIELILKIVSIENVNMKYDKTSKTQQYVYQTINYIENNFNKKILIEDISSAIHISNRYLSKIFYQETGTTIAQYINIYRINQAINLMSNNNLTLSEISEMVGLNDIQHFSKVFNKIINLTPQKYRKLIDKNK